MAKQELKKQEQQEQVKLYSISELCNLLSVSEDFIYRQIKSKSIEAFKVGNRWRVPATELQKLIKKGA